MLRPPHRRLLAALAALAMLTASPHEGMAGGTKTLTIDDFDDFDEGETEGVAVEGTGRLTVGYVPQRGEVAEEASLAFLCHASASGTYIATADKATIQRITIKRGKVKAKAKAKPKAKAKDKDKAKEKEKEKAADSPLTAEVVAELPGAVVSALAELPGGDLLAATLPGGTIHRITPKGAKPKIREFAKLDVTQIWAIVPHRGRILVATGPKGELYSLDAKGGDPKVILDVDEKDLLSVLVDGDTVVVGTSPRAHLYQVTDDLGGALLHDFKGDEIRALALTQDGLAVAVNDFSDRGLSAIDALTKNLNRTSLLGQPPEGSSESQQQSVQASATLYHVNLRASPGSPRDLTRAGEATWETWLAKSKQYFTAAIAGDGGREVLVASSYDGKVYRVRGRRDRATVADFDERKATDLCRLGDGSVLATTGDGAAIYRLDNTKAQRPRYKSKVFDTKQPATFGAIVLRGRGDLEVRARVGPSDAPDSRWSAWAPIPLRPARDGLRGRVGLSKRRFLQLEITLASGDAEVRGVELFYAPENLPPQVKAIELEGPSFKIDDESEPASKMTISWKADAHDGDDLIYDVRLRPEGGDDRTWIRLNDEPLSKKELKWDLGSVPDGIYEVEVLASDEPTNGITGAATDAQVSAPFIVDRQRPTIRDIKVDGRRIAAVADDDGGAIHDIAFSVNGGPFRPASPADGLLDSDRETFTALLPDDLRSGRHRVVLRARDHFGNIGAVAVLVDL